MSAPNSEKTEHIQRPPAWDRTLTMSSASEVAGPLPEEGKFGQMKGALSSRQRRRSVERKGATGDLSSTHVQGRIENEPWAREFLIDSGSSANLMSRRICEKIERSAVPCDVTEVYGVSGEGLPVLGQTTLNTHLGNSEKSVTHLVVPQLGKTILGTPALRQFEFSINCSEEYLQRPCRERLFCHAASKAQLQKTASSGDLGPCEPNFMI